LVFTSLTKEALPVIRYRTRDLTRLLPPTARSMRRMDRITGRTDDMLIIRGVNVFPSQIEELICKTSALAPHYLLIADKDGHLDSLIVRVELISEMRYADRDTVAHELQHNIKSYIGVSSQVEVLEPFAIERVTVGKAKRVIDKRPKG
jgi:phenylacetate-CoA ligase